MLVDDLVVRNCHENLVHGAKVEWGGDGAGGKVLGKRRGEPGLAGYGRSGKWS